MYIKYTINYKQMQGYGMIKKKKKLLVRDTIRIGCNMENPRVTNPVLSLTSNVGLMQFT